MAGSPSSTSSSTNARWCRAGGLRSRPLARARSCSTNCESTWPDPWGPVNVESAAWRWSAGRPRVALGLAFPSPRGLPGIVSFDGSWERQSYGATRSSGDATLMREERRRIGVHLGDWLTSRLRWQTGVTFDRLRAYGALDQNRSDARDYLAVESTVDAAPGRRPPRRGGVRRMVDALRRWCSIRYGRTAGGVAFDRRRGRSILVRRDRDSGSRAARRRLRCGKARAPARGAAGCSALTRSSAAAC